MKTIAVQMVSLVALLSVHTSAKGDTIISTFGPSSSYNPCCGWGNVAPTELAYSFVIGSGSDFTFTGAALALSQGIGSTNAVDINLASDASDQPGTVLETFHLVDALGPAGADNSPVVVASVLQPLLLAGSQYWLIESPSVLGNGVNWSTANIVADNEQRAAGGNSGSFWDVFTISRFDGPGAFSVSGTPVSNTVPEIDPGSGMSALALLTSALLVIRGHAVTPRA